MDAKFMKRFESFQNSLDALKEARTRDMSDRLSWSRTAIRNEQKQ